MLGKMLLETASMITPYLKLELKLLEDAMTDIKTNLQKQYISKIEKRELLL